MGGVAPPWYYKSPFFEDRSWPWDVSRPDGIRFRNDRDQVYGMRLPGNPPVKHISTHIFNLSDVLVMTTPSPPPVSVIMILQKLLTPDFSHQALKDQYGNGTRLEPWISFADYAVLYKYMNSIMTIDGDEDRWRNVARAVPPANGDMEHINLLVQLYSSSFSLAQVYSTIGHRFANINNGKLGTLTQDQWVVQQYMRPVTSADDYRHVIDELITQLIPAPHYNMPTQSMFDQGMHPTPNFSHADLGWMQGFIAGLFYHYTASYPAFEAEVSKPIILQFKGEKSIHYQPNTFQKVSIALVQGWIHCFGESVTYAQLRDGWDKKDRKKIESCAITLKQRHTQPAFWLPGPNANELTDMKAFDELFQGGNEVQLPVIWITRIGAFMERLWNKQTPSGFNAKELLTQTTEPTTTLVGAALFQQLCELYYSYVSFCKLKTDNWKNVKDAEWNDHGLNDKEQKNVDMGNAPFSKKAANARWPNPDTLPLKEYKEYLKYMSGATKGDYPPIRPQAPVEDSKDYNERVRQSQANYDLWFESMITYQKTIKKHPIGTNVLAEVEQDDGKTKKMSVPVWFSDFGVWDDNATETQQYVQAFWSPIKTLTGHTVFEHGVLALKEMIKIATAVFDALIVVLLAVLKGLGQGLNYLLLPIVVIGGMAILGLREASNAGVIGNRKHG